MAWRRDSSTARRVSRACNTRVPTMPTSATTAISAETAP